MCLKNSPRDSDMHIQRWFCCACNNSMETRKKKEIEQKTIQKRNVIYNETILNSSIFWQDLNLNSIYYYVYSFSFLISFSWYVNYAIIVCWVCAYSQTHTHKSGQNDLRLSKSVKGEEVEKNHDTIGNNKRKMKICIENYFYWNFYMSLIMWTTTTNWADASNVDMDNFIYFSKSHSKLNELKSCRQIVPLLLLRIYTIVSIVIIYKLCLFVFEIWSSALISDTQFKREKRKKNIIMSTWMCVCVCVCGWKHMKKKKLTHYTLHTHKNSKIHHLKECGQRKPINRNNIVCFS